MTIDGLAQPLGGIKPRAVLAMLVINRNFVVSAESLAAAAWDDHPPEEFRASLHVIVSNLRKVLRIANRDPKAVLATASPGYRLSITDQECDLGRFRALTAAGSRFSASGRHEEASTHYVRALAEWKGPALEDLQGLRFADAVSVALQEERLITETARAESEIACGRAEIVIADLVSLTNNHPLREPLWGQLISALYTCGRQSDALAACRRLRSILAEEGIDPSPPLQDLENRILRQQPLSDRLPTLVRNAMALTITERRPEAARARIRDKFGRVIPIEPGGLRIGRMLDNDLVLDQGKVSRHHAVIEDTGAQFIIRDLQSSNGTVVSGHAVVDSTALTNGDVIRIGDDEFSFEVFAPGDGG